MCVKTTIKNNVFIREIARFRGYQIGKNYTSNEIEFMYFFYYFFIKKIGEFYEIDKKIDYTYNYFAKHIGENL